MRRIVSSLLMGLWGLSFGAAHAGTPARLGTAGALELLIPTDARGVAMGGSVMAEGRGVQSLFWNPAGAAVLQGDEIAVSHRRYIADIGMSHLAYARETGALGTLGLSAKVLSTDGDQVYTVDQPDGTGETFATSFVVVGLSLARTMTDRVSVGVNAHYVAEQIHRETAQGLAFDIGFVYRPTIAGLTLGVAIKNYGPKMRFDGPDFSVPSGDENPDAELRSRSASFELPSFIQFGLAWNGWSPAGQNVTFVGAFQANNFSEDEFRLGTEWALADQLFLRGGYVASPLDGFQYGFSGGAGLRIPFGESVTSVDYAWVDAGVFESNHLFTVTLAF